MAAFQMQLNEFVIPAYFSENSLFFYSFANTNLVGGCILALFKCPEYGDDPVHHNKAQALLLHVGIYFF